MWVLNDYPGLKFLWLHRQQNLQVKSPKQSFHIHKKGGGREKENSKKVNRKLLGSNDTQLEWNEFQLWAYIAKLHSRIPYIHEHNVSFFLWFLFFFLHKELMSHTIHRQFFFFFKLKIMHFWWPYRYFFFWRS